MSGGFGRAPGKSSSLQEQASKVIAPAAPGKRTLTDQLRAVQEPIFPSATPAQRKTTTSAATDAGGPPPPGGAGTPLPPDVRTRMETALGASFAAVRVHEDAYAQRIGAQAFTRGVDLFFAPGRFDPRSPQGLELIGHELTHVKQQAEGRVPVTARIDGAPANDDPGLEREADELGAKAARAMAARGATAPHAGAGSQIANAPTAPASHVPVQAKADGAAIDAPPGSEPRVEDLDEVDAADASNASAASMAPIQKAPTGQPGKARRPRRTISRSRSPWQSR